MYKNFKLLLNLQYAARPKIVKLEIRHRAWDFFSLDYEIRGYPFPINRTWLFNGDENKSMDLSDSIETVSSEDSIIKGGLRYLSKLYKFTYN